MTLKTRINIAAVISILLVALTLLVFGRLIENSVEVRFNEASLTGKTALWRKIISSQFDHMEANTSSITRDRVTLKAMKDKNISLLAENVVTTYNLLSTSGILTKLQIADLNGQILYSTPESFTGRTRKTLQLHALQEGKVLRGVERDDDGKLYINLAIPVYVRGKPVGVVFYMRDLQSAINDFKLNDNSDTYIVNDTGHVEYTTNKDFFNEFDIRLPTPGSQSMTVNKVGDQVYSVVILPLVGFDKHALAHIVSTKNQTESYHAQQAFTLFSYASIIAIIFISVIGLTWYLRKNFKPLDTVVERMQRISQGDLTDIAEGITNKDEIGQLFLAMNYMTDNIRHIVGEVYTASDNINKTSHEIATGNTDLAQRTQEQSSSLEEVAASMEEMASTVRQNSESAQHANQLSSTARDNAVLGQQVVKRTIDAMSEISGSSNKIADIISTIDSIAFQTNLLALNAAVEAARAGDQGRGFAVVASEVRTLAQRSAEAAREIKHLINDSVEKVKIGSDLVDESSQTLSGIVADIKKVAEIVSEISSASDEQSSGINQINNAVTQMDAMTQKNATLVDESASANRLLYDQALRLTKLMEFFQLNIPSSTSTKHSHHLAIARDVSDNNEVSALNFYQD